MEAEAYREMDRMESRHWWFRGRRAVLRAALTRFLPETRDLHLLEIGSGTGGNFELLSDFGKLDAVEPDPLARSLAKAKSARAVPIMDASLPELKGVPRATYDVVCGFDVLEHLDDDVAALHAIRAVLKPGGAALLSVPAYPILFGPHDEFLHHKRRYRKAELERRARQAGFVVAYLGYFNFWLLPLAVISRIHDRLRRAKAAAGLALPPAWLNSLLGGVFASEAKLIGRCRMVAGLSLLLFVRRPVEDDTA